MKRALRESVVVYFVLTLLFSCSVYAESSRAAEYLFEVGKSYYERGNYQQALHELRKVLLVEPQHTQALAYIEMIEDELKSPQEEQASGPVREDALNQALDEAAEILGLETQIEQAQEEILPLVEEVRAEKEQALQRELEKLEKKLGRQEEPKAQGAPATEAESVPVELPKSKEGCAQPAVGEKRVPFAPFASFDNFIEQVNENIAPAKISGEYTVSLGASAGDVLWKDANGDYNEANWRRVDKDFGVNTYDRRVYDRLRVNLDTENEQGLNVHGNLTIDPWSFIGKSDELTLTSVGGETAQIQLKYWSNTRSTINDSVDSTSDVFSLPEIKIIDDKSTPAVAKGVEFTASSYDTINIPELEIHRELWPIREFWLDYVNGDDFQFRFFPIAYENQALTSDDPLQLSNHKIYWEESPWLDRWQPGKLHTDTAPQDFTKGVWEDDLSFFTRDSNMTRLTGLRGASIKSEPLENLSISSTVASPKGLWQDYDAFDNIEGASRLKFSPNEELQLGLINTFRYGLEEAERDAENHVVGADMAYQLTADTQIKGQVAYSKDKRDLTQSPYNTEKSGNAYRVQMQRGKVQEERPEKWDKEAQEESVPLDWTMRFTYTHMDKGFYPALANYRITRQDPFWGRHLYFKEPYQEYYGGLYYPTLSWYDIRPYRIGDSVDIDRDTGALRLERAFLDGDMELLFDCRRAYEASRGKYIETVGRVETDWQVNEQLLLKFLAIYQDLPKTKGGIDPIVYDVDTDKFYVNSLMEDGKDPSLKTASGGFKYDFFDWASLDFIYEYTNDFTLALDDYPRRLLSNPNFTTVTENHLTWREPAPYLYDQYLFPLPPYPWFNIWKAGLEFKPSDELKLRLEFTKNDYKFASQIDDNINHWGLTTDWDITDNLSLKCSYVFSQNYNLQGRGEGLDYQRHHNVFLNLDYKMEDKGVFSLQFGESAILPFNTMFTTSPYPGFLPTLDTAHIVRAYFSRQF